MKINISMLLIIASFSFSCNRNELIFKVSNHSEKEIDSVTISGLGDVTLVKLKSNSEVSGIWDLTKTKSNSDGQYNIRIYTKDSIRNYSFGYYSNGLPQSEQINISIKPDTIDVVEVL